LSFSIIVNFLGALKLQNQGTITTGSSPNVTFSISMVNMLKITLGDGFVV
jgi:hypothetical protein